MAKRRPKSPGRHRFVVAAPVRFLATPTPNPGMLKRQVERLEHQVREEVLWHIAGEVAGQIADLIPAGRGGKYHQSYAALRALWAGWSARPADGGKGGFWIGSVAQMNAATGAPMANKAGGAWRYGSWFNLEWGREWPNKTGSWTYQENPGEGARSPADSKPPGAGPADIAMQQWLSRRLRPKTGGEASLIHRAMSGHDEARRAGLHRQHLSVWMRHNEAMQATRGRNTKRLIGVFGKAPIRIGWAEGVRVADQHIPQLMKVALQHMGKAR